ncbi:hypothetical protein EDB19DRAFT_1716869 [Suillus lakei]|nr:hypothetical protein EDB19DRAFT_1716869 [Suillus lakei]
MKHADRTSKKLWRHTSLVSCYRIDGKARSRCCRTSRAPKYTGSSSTIMKLRSFCNVVHDAVPHWAWSDTGHVDKVNNVELQELLNSTFVGYHHSALTIVYLSDVPPSFESSALANNAWTMREWTVGECLAPKIILLYQKNWTPYLNDPSPNHRVRHDHARVGECNGHISKGPCRLPPRDVRRSGETPMGIDARCHVAGRHRILIGWILMSSYRSSMTRRSSTL